MKITRNELKEIIREVITERSTWKRPKSYFVAPKNAKYKDEKEVEKKFKRIPSKLKNFLTTTPTGIEINKKKFHEDAEELDENIDDGTEYYLEDYVVILDKKGGKNLMRVQEFRVDDYPEFALNAGLD
tara:strand:+ start:149 stop:532 length:384 start_codon:yes stop_codon:yes gene_type:complete